MLSASLLLASALLAPQDEAAATNDSVREFLLDVAATLYDPVAAGLESLSFDLPVVMPTGMGDPINLSDVHVDWTKDGEPAFEVSRSGELDPMVQQMFQMQGISDVDAAVEGMSIGMAQQPLLQALNRGFDVDGMLGSNTATLGSEDGQVTVTFVPNAELAAQVPIKDFVWYFDEDLRPVRKVATMEQPNPMMGGTMKITITENHVWRDGPDGLVIESVETTQDLGMMKMTSTRTVEYTQFGELLVMTGFTDASAGNPAMGMPSSSTKTELANVQVNGRAAGGAAEGDGEG